MCRPSFTQEELSNILHLHDYHLVCDIGTGCYGTVFLCISDRDQEQYAVKVGNEKATLQELQVLQSIWHPNIIYIYETFVESGCTFIVLEYCPGGTIADVLADGPMPRSQLFVVAEQLVNALRVCHSAKIAHGDIKPQNIFMNKCGRAKLADFGLAKVHEGDLSVQFKGSLGYLAPEVLRHDAFDPFKADVWSLGVTFYCMAAGKLPWPEQLKQAQFHDYICGGLAQVDPAVPPEFAAILQTMIVGDPASRVSADQINTVLLHQTALHSASFNKTKSRHGRTWSLDMSKIKMSASCLTGERLAEVNLVERASQAASTPEIVTEPEEAMIVKRVTSLQITQEKQPGRVGLDFQLRAARHFLKRGATKS
jgi:serine/threonine protein kinase